MQSDQPLLGDHSRRLRNCRNTIVWPLSEGGYSSWFWLTECDIGHSCKNGIKRILADCTLASNDIGKGFDKSASHGIFGVVEEREQYHRFPREEHSREFQDEWPKIFQFWTQIAR